MKHFGLVVYVALSCTPLLAYDRPDLAERQLTITSEDGKVTELHLRAILPPGSGSDPEKVLEREMTWYLPDKGPYNSHTGQYSNVAQLLADLKNPRLNFNQVLDRYYPENDGTHSTSAHERREGLIRMREIADLFKAPISRIPRRLVPPSLAGAIEKSGSQTLSVLSGTFAGALAVPLKITLPKGSDLLVQNFLNHAPLDVDGEGKVFLGKNHFMSAAHFNVPSVQDIDQGSTTPHDSESAHTSLLDRQDPTSLSQLALKQVRDAVHRYCASSPRDRSLLDGIVPPDFSVLTDESKRYPYVKHATTVTCGNLTLDYINDATVLVDGQLNVKGYISDRSVVVADRIQAEEPRVYIQQSVLYPPRATGLNVDDRRAGERVWVVDTSNGSLATKTFDPNSGEYQQSGTTPNLSPAH